MRLQHPYSGITTGLLKPITAALSIVALLAGCGSVEAKDSQQEVTSADKVVSVNITEPSNGLLPSDTSDMAGWKIVSQLYDGLVTFDAEGNETLVEAESITPNDDASEYTIALKPNLAFSNGEKITADTYAKSWSFAANAANGQVGASIFEDIQGYDELQDASGSKTAQLSGLTVVDDTTLKVKLKASNSAFLYKIGDIAFLPMPSEVIKNPKEYGQKPIGNGPYKLKAYKSGEEIILEKDDSYKGPREVKNAGIDFKVYQSLDAAYSDLLADNLDVLDAIPTSALKTYQNEKSITAVSKPGPSFSAFTISQNLDHFQGEEGKYRRQAIAHAIDRENIANAIFGGTVTPATDFLAPVIKGYDTDLDTDGKPRNCGPRRMPFHRGAERSASPTVQTAPIRSGWRLRPIPFATRLASMRKAIRSPRPRNCAAPFRSAPSTRHSNRACNPIIRIRKAIWCRHTTHRQRTARV